MDRIHGSISGHLPLQLMKYSHKLKSHAHASRPLAHSLELYLRSLGMTISVTQGAVLGGGIRCILTLCGMGRGVVSPAHAHTRTHTHLGGEKEVLLRRHLRHWRRGHCVRPTARRQPQVHAVPRQVRQCGRSEGGALEHGQRVYPHHTTHKS